MGKLILLPCIALLTAASPAASAPPAVANSVASPDGQSVTLSGGRTAPAAEEKKICRQLDTTGSRVPRRACLTEKEWRQLQQELEQ
jgi:hypothetical protein